jgi:hypothetical protein
MTRAAHRISLISREIGRQQAVRGLGKVPGQRPFGCARPALDSETQTRDPETRDLVQPVYVSNPESFASQIQN